MSRLRTGGVALAALLVIAGTSARAQVDAAWTQLAKTGPQPLPRRDAGVIYDPVRDRLVVVAGGGETWTLDLSTGATWVKLPIPAYQSSGYERAVYDPAADRMVLINSNMQVYALSLANPTSWNLMSTAGSPPPRTFFATTHDDARNRLILYGGGPYTGIFNDIWALDLNGTPTWNQIVPSGPAPTPTWGPLAVYDPTQDRLIVGMGAADLNYTVNSNLVAVNLSGAPEWTPIDVGGVVPSGRMLTAVVFDAGLNRMLMFSGYPNVAADTRSLEFSPSPAWIALSPAGDIPPSSWSSAAVFRTQSAQMILFAGHNGGDFTGTWALTAAGPSGRPILASFSPSGGRVGDVVTIFGQRLDSATDVQFNGVSAPIHSKAFGQLETEVPVGATTGPISVANASGTASFVTSFFVGEPPEVTAIDPDSGKAGATIAITGSHLTGTTKVQFGGTGSAAFTVVSDNSIQATVDLLASTGLVSVTTPGGTGVSSVTFTRIQDDPRPHLLSVRDVRGDQGGKVLLRWKASDFDQSRYKVITGYRVWRRAPLNDARGSARGAEPARVARPGAATADAPDEFWENIAQLPASFLPGYAYAAATLSDSSDAGNPFTAYFVQATTADPYTFYNSSPDSGYSVDNLAPPTPSPLTVTYGGESNLLHWHAAGVGDLRGYEIYRGSTSTFAPSSTNLIAATAETTFADAPGNHFYKLTSVDVHGNRSRYVAASPDIPVGVLASFVRFDREAGRLRVTWYSGGNTGMQAHIYRRTEVSDWRMLGIAQVDGTGYLTFEDAAVEDNQRYAYRLGIIGEEGAGETFTSEAWVDPIGAPAISLSLGSNPSAGGRLRMGIVVPGAGRVTVSLFDPAGRELEHRVIELEANGRAEVELGSSGSLRPGLYLVRAVSGPVAVVRRAVILR